MAQDMQSPQGLERRLAVRPGSNIFDQPVFTGDDGVFEIVRKFLRQEYPSLEDITDEQLSQLLIFSRVEYGNFNSRVKHLRQGLGMADNAKARPIYDHLQKEVFPRYKHLKDYLKSLPQLTRGVEAPSSGRNVVQTYAAFVSNAPRNRISSIPTPPQQKDFAPVEGSDLSRYFKAYR